jgi:hypothetical protein
VPATQAPDPAGIDDIEDIDIDAATDERKEKALREGRARRVFVRKIASCAVVAIFVAALLDALQFKGLGSLFPILASSAGLAISLVYAGLTLAGKDLGTSAYDLGNEDLGAGLAEDDLPQWWVYVGLVAFPVLTAALGLVPAIVLWMPAFLILVARLRLWQGVVGMAAALAVLYALQLYIGMVFPGSIFVS